MNFIQRVLKNKYLFFLILIFISIIIFWPSFDLALTGDDYLGYWRLEYTLRQGGSFVSHFFTDYGPQDLLTALIHSKFGFASRIYYILAFFLRIIAAFSLYPLTFLLTRSKKSATLASVFFIFSTVGMEILDWSFNMPSYLGIIFMNLSLLFLLKSFVEKYFGNLFLAVLFFIFSIISQPLRLLVLVVIELGITVYIFIVDIKGRKKAMFSSLILVVSFLSIYSFSKYGAVSGVKDQGPDQNVVRNTLQNISQSIESSGTVIILSPIAQIGNIMFPTDSIPERIKSSKILQTNIFLLFSFIGFQATFNYLNKTKKPKFAYYLLIIGGVLWTVLLNKTLMPLAGIKIIIANYLGYLVGGYFVLIFLYLLSQSDKKLKLGLFISILLITTPILPVWIRNPGIIVSTYSRYLIVSSGGLALFLGIIFNQFKKRGLVIITIVLFTLVNVLVVKKYLNHLHASRNIKLADNIRSSLIYKTDWKYKTPVMIFFLDTDNTDIFYHSLYFGFPFFINYYKGELQNPWNIAYTTDWTEVENSYKDGSGLKRFGVSETGPVKMENIFSYKIQYGKLLDTTSSTREKLYEAEKLRNITN